MVRHAHPTEGGEFDMASSTNLVYSGAIFDASETRHDIVEEDRRVSTKIRAATM